MKGRKRSSMGIFLYSTFPFLRLELIAMINSPSIFAVGSSLGRKSVNNAIAVATRKLGSTNRAKRRVSSSFDNAVPLLLTCFVRWTIVSGDF